MLHIISTPIGNLEDISFRAVRLLRESDYVLAEDTRRTNKLFFHYSIKNKLISYNDKNKERKTSLVIQDLIKGKNIGLVSDSGTPGISDPGFYLVRECVKNNIKVSPIPGACAFVSALVCSGLPTDKFTFYGFLPKNNSKKFKVLEEIKVNCHTAIFYESPHRINKTLNLISDIMPSRAISVSRELTKKFEEIITGSDIEINPKGEFTVIVGGLKYRH